MTVYKYLQQQHPLSVIQMTDKYCLVVQQVTRGANVAYKPLLLAQYLSPGVSEWWRGWRWASSVARGSVSSCATSRIPIRLTRVMSRSLAGAQSHVPRCGDLLLPAPGEPGGTAGGWHQLGCDCWQRGASKWHRLHIATKPASKQVLTPWELQCQKPFGFRSYFSAHGKTKMLTSDGFINTNSKIHPVIEIH